MKVCQCEKRLEPNYADGLCSICRLLEPPPEPRGQPKGSYPMSKFGLLMISLGVLNIVIAFIPPTEAFSMVNFLVGVGCFALVYFVEIR